MGAVSQFFLVLKKNLLLRSRQPGLLIFEVCWPLAVFLIVWIIRRQIPPVPKPNCEYDARALPSAGVLPFLQSMVCSLDNECRSPDYEASKSPPVAQQLVSRLAPYMNDPEIKHALESVPETLDIIDAVTLPFKNKNIKDLIENGLTIGDLFKNQEELVPYLSEEENILPENVTKTLLKSRINMDEMFSSSGYVDFKGVACNESALQEYLILSPGEATEEEVSKALCALDSDHIPVLVEAVQQHLDVEKIFDVVSSFSSAVGEYDLAVAMQDIGAMLDMARNFSLTSSHSNFIPYIDDLNDWTKHFQMFTDSLQTTSVDFTFIDTFLNDLDPMLQDNPKWNELKRNYLFFNSMLETANRDLGSAPDVNITFWEVFKDPVFVQEELAQLYNLSESIISTLLRSRLNPSFIRKATAIRNNVPDEEILAYICQNFVSMFYVIPSNEIDLRNILALRDAICKDAKSFQTQIQEQLDYSEIDTLIQQYLDNANKTIANERINWTHAFVNAQQLLKTLTNFSDEYGELIETLAQISVTEMVQTLVNSYVHQTTNDEAITHYAQLVLEAYLGKDHALLTIDKVDLAIQILQSIVDKRNALLANWLEIFHSVSNYEAAKNAMQIVTDPENLAILLKKKDEPEDILCSEVMVSSLLNKTDIDQAIMDITCNQLYLDYVSSLLDNSIITESFQRLISSDLNFTDYGEYIPFSDLHGIVLKVENLLASFDSYSPFFVYYHEAESNYNSRIYSKAVSAYDFSHMSVATLELGPIAENNSDVWAVAGPLMDIFKDVVLVIRTHMSNYKGQKEYFEELVMSGDGAEIVRNSLEMLIDPKKAKLLEQRLSFTNPEYVLCDSLVLDHDLKMDLSSVRKFFCDPAYSYKYYYLSSEQAMERLSEKLSNLEVWNNAQLNESFDWVGLLSNLHRTLTILVDLLHDDDFGIYDWSVSDDVDKIVLHWMDRLTNASTAWERIGDDTVLLLQEVDNALKGLREWEDVKREIIRFQFLSDHANKVYRNYLDPAFDNVVANSATLSDIIQEFANLSASVAQQAFWSVFISPKPILAALEPQSYSNLCTNASLKDVFEFDNRDTAAQELTQKLCEHISEIREELFGNETMQEYYKLLDGTLNTTFVKVNWTSVVKSITEYSDYSDMGNSVQKLLQFLSKVNTSILREAVQQYDLYYQPVKSEDLLKRLDEIIPNVAKHFQSVNRTNQVYDYAKLASRSLAVLVHVMNEKLNDLIGTDVVIENLLESDELNKLLTDEQNEPGIMHVLLYNTVNFHLVDTLAKVNELLNKTFTDVCNDTDLFSSLFLLPPNASVDMQDVHEYVCNQVNWNKLYKEIQESMTPPEVSDLVRWWMGDSSFSEGMNLTLTYKDFQSLVDHFLEIRKNPPNFFLNITQIYVNNDQKYQEIFSTFRRMASTMFMNNSYHLQKLQQELVDFDQMLLRHREFAIPDAVWNLTILAEQTLNVAINALKETAENMTGGNVLVDNLVKSEELDKVIRSWQLQPDIFAVFLYSLLHYPSPGTFGQVSNITTLSNICNETNVFSSVVQLPPNSTVDIETVQDYFCNQVNWTKLYMEVLDSVTPKDVDDVVKQWTGEMAFVPDRPLNLTTTLVNLLSMVQKFLELEKNLPMFSSGLPQIVFDNDKRYQEIWAEFQLMATNMFINRRHRIEDIHREFRILEEILLQYKQAMPERVWNYTNLALRTISVTASAIKETAKNITGANVLVENLVKSEELDKVLTSMQREPDIVRVVLYNLLQFPSEEAFDEFSNITTLSNMCSGTNVFEAFIELPPNSTVDIKTVQDYFCQQVNWTKLYMEVMDSVTPSDIREVVRLWMDGSFDESMINITLPFYDIVSTIQYLLELENHPPKFSTNVTESLFDYKRYEEIWNEFQSIFIPAFNQEMHLLEQLDDLAATFDSLMLQHASSVDPQAWNYVKRALHSIKTLSDTLTDKASELTGAHVLVEKLVKSETLDDVVESLEGESVKVGVLLYNLLHRPLEMIQALANETITIQVCTNINAFKEVVVLPPNSRVDLASLKDYLCLQTDWQKMSQEMLDSLGLTIVVNQWTNASFINQTIPEIRFIEVVNSLEALTKAQKRLEENRPNITYSFDYNQYSKIWKEVEADAKNLYGPEMFLNVSLPLLMAQASTFMNKLDDDIQNKINYAVRMALYAVDTLNNDKPRLLHVGQESYKLQYLIRNLWDFIDAWIYTQWNDPFKAYISREVAGSGDFCHFDLNELLLIPPNSTFNVAQFQWALCNITGANLTTEIDKLPLTSSGEFASNLLSLIGGVTDFKSRGISALITHPPILSIEDSSPPPWLNDTYWIEAYEDFWTQVQNNNGSLLQFVDLYEPLIASSEEMRQALVMVDSILDVALSRIYRLKDKEQISIDDLFYRDDQLKKFVNDVLPIAPDLLHMMLIGGDHTKLLELFSGQRHPDEILSEICENGIDVYFATPGFTVTDYKRIQENLCVLNITQFSLDLRRFAGVDYIHLQQDGSYQVSLRGTLQKLYLLDSLILNLSLNERSFIKDKSWMFSSDWLKAVNYTGVPLATTMAKLQEQIFLSLAEVKPLQDHFTPYFYSNVIDAKLENLLASLTVNNGTIDFADMFVDTKELHRLLNFVLASDLSLDLFISSFLSPGQLSVLIQHPEKLENVFCDEEDIRTLLVLPYDFNFTSVIDALCGLNTTVLMEEVKDLFQVDSIIDQLTSWMPSNFSAAQTAKDHLRLNKAINEHIARLSTAKRVYFEDVDLKQHFGKFSAHDWHPLYLYAHDHAFLFYQLVHLMDNLGNAYYSPSLGDISRFTNAFGKIIDILDDKVQMIAAENLTVDDLFQDFPHVRKFLKDAFRSAPFFLPALLRTDINLQSYSSFNETWLCTEDRKLGNLLVISPKVNTSALEQLLCIDNNITAIQMELHAIANNSSIAEIFTEMPEEGPFNLTSVFMSLYRLVTNLHSQDVFTNFTVYNFFNFDGDASEYERGLSETVPRSSLMPFVRLVNIFSPLLNNLNAPFAAAFKQAETFLIVHKEITNVINKKLLALLVGNFTLDDVLQDSPNTKQFLESVFEKAPYYLEAVMSADINDQAFISNKISLCTEDGKLGNLLIFGGDVDTSVLEQLLCVDTNFTAVQAELSKEFSISKLVKAFAEENTNKLSLRNWTSTVLSLQGFSSLLDGLRYRLAYEAPNIYDFFNFGGNTTIYEQHLVAALEANSARNKEMEKLISQLDELMPLLENSTVGRELIRQIRLQDITTQMLTAELMKHLSNRTLTLNEMVNNSTQFIEVLDALTAVSDSALQDFFSADFKLEKFQQLISSDDPQQMLCNTSLADIITLQPTSVSSLDDVKQSICSLNVTLLVKELNMQPSNSFQAEIYELYRPDANLTVNWLEFFKHQEEYQLALANVVRESTRMKMKSFEEYVDFGGFDRFLKSLGEQLMNDSNPEKLFQVWTAFEPVVMQDMLQKPSQRSKYIVTNDVLSAVFKSLIRFDYNLSLHNLNDFSDMVAHFLRKDLHYYYIDRLSQVSLIQSIVCDKVSFSDLLKDVNIDADAVSTALCNSNDTWYFTLEEMNIPFAEKENISRTLLYYGFEKDYDGMVKVITKNYVNISFANVNERNENFQQILNDMTAFLSGFDYTTADWGGFLSELPLKDQLLDVFFEFLSDFDDGQPPQNYRWQVTKDTINSFTQTLEDINEQLNLLEDNFSVTSLLEKPETIVELMSWLMEEENLERLINVSINGEQLIALRHENTSWDSFLPGFPKALTDKIERQARYRFSGQVQWNHLRDLLKQLFSHSFVNSSKSSIGNFFAGFSSDWLQPIMNTMTTYDSSSFESICEVTEKFMGNKFVNYSSVEVVWRLKSAMDIVVKHLHSQTLEDLLCEMYDYNPAAMIKKWNETQKFLTEVTDIFQGAFTEMPTCKGFFDTYNKFMKLPLMNMTSELEANNKLLMHVSISTCVQLEPEWNLQQQIEYCEAGLVIARQQAELFGFTDFEEQTMLQIKSREIALEQMLAVPAIGEIICDIPSMNFSTFYSRIMEDLHISSTIQKVNELKRNLRDGFNKSVNCTEVTSTEKQLMDKIVLAFENLFNSTTGDLYLRCLSELGEASLWHEIDAIIQMMSSVVPLLQNNTVVEEILKVTNPDELQSLLDNLGVSVTDYIGQTTDITVESLHELGDRLNTVTKSVQVLLNQGIIIDFRKIDLENLDLSNVIQVVHRALDASTIGTLSNAIEDLLASLLGFFGFDENSPVVNDLETVAKGVEGLQALRFAISRDGSSSSAMDTSVDAFPYNTSSVSEPSISFGVTVPVKDVITEPKAFTEFLVDNITLPDSVVNSVMNSSFHINEILLNSDGVEELVCDPHQLAKTLRFAKDTDIIHISNSLCNLKSDRLGKILDHLVKELSIGKLIQELINLGAEEILHNADYTKVEVANLVQDAARASSDVSEFFTAIDEILLEPELKVGQSLKSISRLVEENDVAAPQALTAMSQALCSNDGDIGSLSDQFQLLKTAGTSDKLTPSQVDEMKSFKTDFCQRLYRDIVTSDGGGVIWSFIRPILQGRILYTPDTPVTRLIMKHANRTFEEIASMAETAQSIGGIHKLTNLQESLDDLEVVKGALKNKFVSGALEKTLGITTDEMLAIVANISSINIDKYGDALDSFSLMGELVANISDCITFDRFVAVDSEADFEAFLKRENKPGRLSRDNIMAAVVFQVTENADRYKRQISSSNDIPKHVIYKIRMDIDNVPLTELVKEVFWQPGPKDNFAEDMRYMRGFIQLQDMIDRAIIELQTGDNSSYPFIFTQQFPYPCHEDDEFAPLRHSVLPILMAIAFSISVGIITRNRVVHKSLEQAMKVMGLRSTIQWISWFCTSFFIMFIITIFLILILRTKEILQFTSWGILFLVFLDFLLSTIMLCYLVSVFFNKPVLAALTGVIIYMLFYFPYIIIITLEYSMKYWHKTLPCLFSTSAFSFVILYMSRYEAQGVGLQWSNIGVSPVPGDEMNVSWACWMMLIDAAIYFIIAWYIENVFPGQWGYPKPFYFPFMPSYWCNMCRTRPSYKIGVRSGQDAKHVETDPSAANALDILVEPDSQILAVGISLRNLGKQYKHGSTPAVDSVNLNFYEGHVTAFLGHNGAGKTTAINMLTGMFPPTTGAAFIYGKDIGSQFNEIRGQLGLCPQHNILFDGLTVQEHLEYFGKLKGTMSKKKLKEDIKHMLETMDLFDLRRERVENLSGGMRRRVSVAIAFVAGSRTVILDEPTSGVDPVARRHIWDLIGAYKDGRTILLSTHHLDEADIMSDRVAIIHKGHLLASGSPLFLKNNLGSGYQLTATKALQASSDDIVRDAASDHSFARGTNCDPKEVLGFVRKFVPSAELVEDIGRELLFVLPTEDSHINQFQPLFTELESNKERLGIRSYGVSGTTLEEVFLALCLQGDEGLDMVGSRNNWQMLRRIRSSHEHFQPRSETQSSPDAKLSTGCGFKFAQFIALFMKRLHHTRRNWKTFLTLLILPCIFIAVAMAFTYVRTAIDDQPPLVLTPAIYGPHNNMFVTHDPGVRSEFQDSYINSLLRSPGIGTVCMDNFPYADTYKCEHMEDGFNIDYVTEEEKQKHMKMKECNCDTGAQSCTEGGVGFVPPRWITNTTDIVYDLREMPTSTEDYLIKTHQEFIEKRYGGWSFGHPEEETPSEQSLRATVWYNNVGPHSMPSYYNSLSNAILRHRIIQSSNSSNSKPGEFGITTVNHPFKLHSEQLSKQTLLQRISDVGIALCILCAFSFIPATFIIFIIEERINEERRLQIVHGVGPLLYWSTTFLYDMICYIVAVAVTLVLMLIFNLPEYTDRLNLGAVVVLLLLFGWATIPMVYMLEKMFREPSSAYLLIFATSMFLGINTMFLLIFLSVFNYIDALANAYTTLQCVFLVFPQYALAGGLLKLIQNQIQTEIFARFGLDIYQNPFIMDMLGWHFIAMAIEGFVFFAITLLVHSCKVRVRNGKLKSCNEKEDDDVALERRRVLDGYADNDLLKITDLTKIYHGVLGKNVAVNRLCLGVPRGECFGLLGVNGAGKTTTFKLLTGELKPSQGDAALNNKSITDDVYNMGQSVGYCPQTNALDDYLTCREMLQFYSRLRGMSNDDREEVVENTLSRFNLEDEANKLVMHLSGGNKRKLCSAISMLGNPDLVLMDEPTTGMDPQTRRQVWNNIINSIKDKRSVILTSHSMEECDNLCTQIGILVNGEFKCLGSPQHLKDRFGEGYTVLIKVGGHPPSLHPVINFMRTNFDGCILKSKQFNTIQFSLPAKSDMLSKIFGYLERERHNLNIEEYTVNQTSLDQVFANLSQKQTDGLEADDVSLDQSGIPELGNAPKSKYIYENPTYDSDNSTIPPPAEFANHVYEELPKQYGRNLLLEAPKPNDLSPDGNLKAEIHVSSPDNTHDEDDNKELEITDIEEVAEHDTETLPLRVPPPAADYQSPPPAPDYQSPPLQSNQKPNFKLNIPVSDSPNEGKEKSWTAVDSSSETDTLQGDSEPCDEEGFINTEDADTWL